MVKIRYFPLLLFCFLFQVLTCATAKEIKTQKLSIGYADACPHMCVDEENKGFTVDIAQAALEAYGYEIEFKALPWARAVANVNNGFLNAVVSTGKEESPLLIYPEQELATQNDCFYGLESDKWQAGDVYSFLNRRTIVFKGWVFEAPYKKTLGKEAYDKLFVHFTIDKSYTDQVIKLVQRGRVNAFWSDSTVFLYYLAKNNLDNKLPIKNLGCVHQQKLYIGFSPKYPELARILADQFDEGMKKLRQTGTLKQILSKYGLRDWRN